MLILHPVELEHLADRAALLIETTAAKHGLKIEVDKELLRLDIIKHLAIQDVLEND